jgi:hypothetical protein
MEQNRLLIISHQECTWMNFKKKKLLNHTTQKLEKKIKMTIQSMGTNKIT